jgi:hypothetical protein
MSDNVKVRNFLPPHNFPRHCCPFVALCDEDLLSEIQKWAASHVLKDNKLKNPPILQLCGDGDDKNHWVIIADILEGASLVLDPLPHAIRSNYVNSDAHALHLDWKATSDDLNLVYTALAQAIAATNASEPLEENFQKGKLQKGKAQKVNNDKRQRVG